MKKVLILTITAGNGHNAAANFMKQKLEMSQSAEVKVVDISKLYMTKLNSWKVDKGYNLSVGHLLPLYNLFYEHFLKAAPDKAATCAAQESVKAVSGPLLKEIYDFQPDVIYGTSYYCGMALTNLKRVYKIPAKVIVCMLDYVISPFWEASVGGVDVMTLSHEDFRAGMLEKGFKNEELVCTGIPGDERFCEKIDKSVARAKLGLRQDLFTALIFYGGGHWHGGYEALKMLINNIKSPMQIIMINGHDKKTKEKIDEELPSYPKNFVVKNYGFSKEVNLIMSASDVMIGKGGGLCTNEIINKRLPLIATTKLPAQEYYNIKFLQNKGTALTFKNAKELTRHVTNLMEHPEELAKMRDKLAPLQSNGIQTIYDIIVSAPEADYSMINKHLDYGKVNKIVDRARKNAAKKKKN